MVLSTIHAGGSSSSMVSVTGTGGAGIIVFVAPGVAVWVTGATGTGCGAGVFLANPCLVISPHPFFFEIRSRYPLIALHTTNG